MTRKVTHKKLKELAEETRVRLNRFFKRKEGRYEYDQITFSSLDLEQRIIKMGYTLAQYQSVLEIFESSNVVRGLDYTLQGINPNGKLDPLLDYKVFQVTESKNLIAEEDRYVKITEEDILLLQSAEAVMQKMWPGSNLGCDSSPRGYSRSFKSRDLINLGLNEKPNFDLDSVINNSPKIQAAKTELLHKVVNILQPASDILKTRVRRHGGKEDFYYVSNMLNNLKNQPPTQEEAELYFNSVVDEVEKAIDAFAKFLVEEQELLSLSVNLKELRLQDPISDDEAENYLELI